MYHQLSEHFVLHATPLIAYACIGLMEPNRKQLLLDADKCGGIWLGTCNTTEPRAYRLCSRERRWWDISKPNPLSSLGKQQLSIARCPRGIPSITRNLIH